MIEKYTPVVAQYYRDFQFWIRTNKLNNRDYSWVGIEVARLAGYAPGTRLIILNYNRLSLPIKTFLRHNRGRYVFEHVRT